MVANPPAPPIPTPAVSRGGLLAGAVRDREQVAQGSAARVELHVQAARACHEVRELRQDLRRCGMNFCREEYLKHVLSTAEDTTKLARTPQSTPHAHHELPDAPHADLSDLAVELLHTRVLPQLHGLLAEPRADLGQGGRSVEVQHDKATCSNCCIL